MVKPNYSKKQPITTKIHPEFTDALLTNYGGVIPFADFLFTKLGFGHVLTEELDLGMGSNCTYATETNPNTIGLPKTSKRRPVGG